ncbi:MAG: hypothetical protein SH817_10945 [Leptospira sp.]|nr:hypothetical protein [Leptospira sp.]
MTRNFSDGMNASGVILSSKKKTIFLQKKARGANDMGGNTNLNGQDYCVFVERLIKEKPWTK